MMGDELITIWDNQGRPTKLNESRNKAHLQGLWHSSVHVFFINQKKQILMQKRSDKVRLYPLKWVATVSGHIKAGQSAVQTAVVETQEELGVNITEEDLFSIGIVRGKFDEPVAGLQEREYIQVFVIHQDPQIDLKQHNDEVAGFKWFSTDELRQLLDQQDDSLVPAWQEYEALLAYLKYYS